MPQSKKLLEIFKPGIFTSNEGQRITFSAEDVAATVAAYDPQKHRAPFVCGHPKTEDPAYGFADSLSLSDSNVMLAEPADVDPAFADAVNNHRYTAISTSFWGPSNPRNPVPGVYYPRHIGFLGAVPPAVPGLKQPSFADDSDLITIDFSDSKQEPDMTPEEKAELLRKQQELAQQQASFADQQTQFKSQQTALAEREAALAAKELKARTDEITSFAEGLVKQGKLLPRDKAGVVALLGALPQEQNISFADGDGKTVEQGTGDFLRKFLNGLPQQVDFSELSAAEHDEGDGGEGVSSFAAPTGYAVDQAQAALHGKALAYQRKNKCDYVTAVKAVS